MMLKEKEGIVINQKTFIPKIPDNSWDMENYQLYLVERN